MVKFKKLLAMLCSVIIAATLTHTASAEKVNLDLWNTDSTLYEVLESGAETNSAVEYVFLRAKFDRPSNRIKLLFMLELDSFTDEANAGVTLSVNGDEEITLHLNGNAEYNEDKYYAQINSASDPMTKTLFLEVILGIKKGIPETVSLEFNVYDTEGIASNTYSVDITQTDGEDTSEAPETEKTSKTKTSKTTKVKTTKSKITKTKTNAANLVENENSDSSDIEDSDIPTGTVNRAPAEVAVQEPVVNERKITAIIAAVTFAAVGTAAGIIHFFRKSRKQRDGG